MMESQSFLSGSRVSRLKSCFASQQMKADAVRGIGMSIILAMTMGDVTAYNILRDGVKSGAIPWYTPDIIIMMSACVEAVSSIFWCCYNGRRRTKIMACTLLPATLVLTFLFAPSSSTTGAEFCSSVATTPSPVFSGLTPAGGTIVALVVIFCAVNACARAAVWAYTVTIVQELKPQRMSLHIGILIVARLGAGALLPRLLTEASWVAVVGVTAPLVVHLLQTLRLREITANTVEWGSYLRVLGSGIAMAQIFAMALLVAALWGYVHHENEIKKVRYMVAGGSVMSNMLEIWAYKGSIAFVVVYGMYYSKHSTFDRVSLLKLVTFVSAACAGVVCALAILLGCSRGTVATLANNYTQPACSLTCGCSVSENAYAPVCVVDSLTTYMSPCHAGCTGVDIIEDLPVYRECTCAPPAGLRRAAAGACSQLACAPALTLHRILAIVLLTLVALALQGQQVVILRSVPVGDQSAAVGLSAAVTLLLACGFGHLAFMAIQASTCAWFEGGQCQFYSDRYPTYIGGLSAGLAGTSALISLICAILLKIRSHPSRDIQLNKTGESQLSDLTPNNNIG